MLKYIVLLYILGTVACLNSQTVYNNGSTLYNTAGTFVYLAGMGYTNGINGSIDNNGNIFVDRDWNNNSASGSVFINTNATGNVTLKGSSTQNIGGTRGTSFENLVMNTTGLGGARLNKPQTILYSLTLTNGIITSDATNLVIVNDNATSSSGSNASHVDGPMKKIGNDNFTFPLGNQGYWARLGIQNASSINTTSEFTARYFKNGYSSSTVDTNSLNNVSTNEYWSLTRGANSDVPAIVLFWQNNVTSGIDSYSNDLRVARYNGTKWIDQGQASMSAGASGNISSTPVTDFSNMAFTFGSLSSTNNPLPIELLSFTGEKAGNGNLIQWQTASEINSSHFILEKSMSGENFNEIFRTKAAGFSQSLLKYDFYDTDLQFGTTYYRLIEIDLDGTKFTSEIISISDTESADLLVFPNPVEHFGEISVSSKNNESISVSIINLSGKTVQIENLENQHNLDFLKIKLSENIVPGAYFIKVQGKSISFSEKLIVR
ncbi:MAG: T9SS type A sorting domain-containing protein [Bacteroidetes bacterium]|nr:T9SS type A sorting domain-containing protein [Bacteroidota bacterium]